MVDAPRNTLLTRADATREKPSSTTGRPPIPRAHQETGRGALCMLLFLWRSQGP